MSSQTYFDTYKEKCDRIPKGCDGVYKNGPYIVITGWDTHTLLVRHHDATVFKFPFEHISEYDTV